MDIDGFSTLYYIRVEFVSILVDIDDWFEKIIEATF